jgi:cation:H+ antiporter
LSNRSGLTPRFTVAFLIAAPAAERAVLRRALYMAGDSGNHNRGVLFELLQYFSLNDPWAYLAVFLGLSLLIMWRLEAMLDHGLEGTALGTLIMPYCSGLGNLIFVGLMISKRGAPGEVLTNCLVNNVTNLTVLLGLPAMIWGLAVVGGGGGGAKVKPGRGAKGGASGSSTVCRCG